MSNPPDLVTDLQARLAENTRAMTALQVGHASRVAEARAEVSGLTHPAQKALARRAREVREQLQRVQSDWEAERLELELAVEAARVAERAAVRDRVNEINQAHAAELADLRSAAQAIRRELGEARWAASVRAQAAARAEAAAARQREAVAQAAAAQAEALRGAAAESVARAATMPERAAARRAAMERFIATDDPADRTRYTLADLIPEEVDLVFDESLDLYELAKRLGVFHADAKRLRASPRPKAAPADKRRRPGRPAVLSAEQVRELRLSAEPIAAMAERMGVSRGYAQQVRYRQARAEVPDVDPAEARALAARMLSSEREETA